MRIKIESVRWGFLLRDQLRTSEQEHEAAAVKAE
jgi:hypothetical protein